MKVDKRGQMKSPKKLRERSGLRPLREVESEGCENSIAPRKNLGKLKLAKWKGRCNKSFEELGYSSVDHFIDDIRGRGLRCNLSD